MEDFKAEKTLTLDDLDIIISLLEAYQETMPKDDEDAPSVNRLVEELNDFTDVVSSRAEYTAGIEMPDDLTLHLTCSQEDIKKLTSSEGQ